MKENYNYSGPKGVNNNSIKPDNSREKHREMFNRSTVIQSSNEFTTELEREKSDALGGNRAKSPDII